MDTKEKRQQLLSLLSDEDLEDLAKILDDPGFRAIEEEEVKREKKAKRRGLKPLVDEIEICH
jgi:hypothetical protein